MRNRMREFLAQRVTMPRWAIAVDFLWRVFLAVGAVTVVVLWYQSATRDEEADRNARIQTCSAGYAATTAAWDAQVALLDQQSESFDRHAETLFSQLIVASASDTDLDPTMLADYESAQEQAEATTAEAKGAARNVKIVTRLRIGLAAYSAESVRRGNAFECPPIPDDLMVRGIDVG